MTETDRLIWDSRVERWRSTIAAIAIPRDLEAVYAKSILAQLNLIYDEVRPEYGAVLKDYHKIDGLIDRVRNLNLIGANEQIRKKASVEAVEGYRIQAEAEPINLFLILDDLDYKKQDIETLLDMIDRKNSLCITMSGLMKVEANLAGR